MITFFRALSWVLICVSLGLLGADIISSLESGHVIIRKTRDIFSILHIELPYLSSEVPKLIRSLYNIIVNHTLWGILGTFSIALSLIFRPLD